MKKLLLASVVLAGVASLFVNAYGQTSSSSGTKKSTVNPNPELPHKIGLVDMARVFKEYEKAVTLREDLKAEFAASEAKAKELHTKAQKLADQMKAFKPGSVEYTDLEKKQGQAATDFELYRKNSQRTLMQRQADIYKTIYLEAMAQVERYAKHFGYTLVMQFNSEDLDGDDPQKLEMSLRRNIVYHRDDDDLTDGIIKSLNTAYKKVAVPQAARRDNSGNN